MKCPKCDYLGFDTGDRCRNCGYDFSLINASLPDHPLDLPLRDPAAAPASQVAGDFSLHVVPLEPDEDATRVLPKAAPRPAVTAAEPALPLFRPMLPTDDDAPLVKLPASPRAPLSVRKTPEVPRLRAVTRPPARRDDAPALAFVADEPKTAAQPSPETEVSLKGDDEDTLRLEPSPPASRVWREPSSSGRPGSAPRRLVAAFVDHAILLGIDVVVIYFTLRMVGLTAGDWTVLPRPPLFAFLVMIKLAYFCAFTALGGQTIGKMAARIRVVSLDSEGELDGSQAARRTLFGALSALVFGLGFLPGLFGDHRTLHDRAARTRVVGLESA